MMSKKRVGLALFLLLGLFIAIPASAHTPMLYVEDYEDGTVYLEGGFSDGSSAEGVDIYLLVDSKTFNGDTTVRDNYLKQIFKDSPEEKLAYIKDFYGVEKDVKLSELEKKMYNGKLVIYHSKLDEYSELTLQKPEGAYRVVFDAGPGHVVDKSGPVLTGEEKEMLEG